MLNIDFSDSQSVPNTVDALERQVDLLVAGLDGNELRCDNVAPGTGFNYNIQRIADHRINRFVFFVDMTQIISGQTSPDALMTSFLRDKPAGKLPLVVVEHAVEMPPRFVEFFRLLAKSGTKIIYKNYRK